MDILGNKKVKAFGMDVSDSSIKIMELGSSGGRLMPVAFADVPLSDKVINNHMIISQERLADNINRAVAKAQKIDTKYVVCSIPEAKSFVRTLQIPKMNEEEIDNAIPYELEQDIPVPIDQVYLDWQIIRTLPDKLELLVTAAPREYIDMLVESVRSAKLIPLAMELESQATARAVIDNKGGNCLIVDMATKQTSFVIVDSGVIQYTSSIPIAGDAFTESIARNLNLSVSAAESLKRKSGLVEEAKEGDIRHAILPILDNVVDEIKNVIRFFEDHDQTKQTIETILLCGGTSKLSGMTDYISARINLGSSRSPIRVNSADPWVNITGKSSKESLPMSPTDALGYATVIGLALRGANYEAD